MSNNFYKKIAFISSVSFIVLFTIKKVNAQ